MTFDDLGLSPEILRAVADAGYTEPTPIQEQAVPVILQGRDVLGCAQSGTGKTAAFALPIIDILAGGRVRAHMPRCLVLTPTRELATQIDENFAIYGKYRKLTTALLIGGGSISPQEKALDRGVDALIATPGRLIDLFERGAILLFGVRILVIDEADRMLDMGFIPDVERIVALLPRLRQTLFFSATLQMEIRKIGETFVHNPKEIRVAPPASPTDTVHHTLAVVKPADKGKTLKKLLAAPAVTSALVFCNRKTEVDGLNRSLKRHGFAAAALHGNMAQESRNAALEAFKRGKVKYLVATDVAGRGLDIYGLSHVFNFDVPTHAEDYVHRIGRTGRAGHRGRAMTLATPEDALFVKAITELIGRDIPRIEISGIGAAPLELTAAKRSRRRGRGGKQAAAEAKATVKAPEAVAGPAEKKSRSRRAKVPREPAKAARKVREPVVGMGDHTPAFFLRPARPRGKGKKKAR